jgi:hypothetical protein
MAQITLDLPDEYVPGLQREADDGGHKDIPALLYAPAVEVAKIGLAKIDAESVAAKVAAFDALPPETQAAAMKASQTSTGIRG